MSNKKLIAKFDLWTKNEETGHVSLGAVTDENCEENKSFYLATPSGTIEMVVDNPDAKGFFELGETYYVEFTKEEKE